MLCELSIRNIVLIDTFRVTFDAGLSVLTGETGAGKSILLDSLTLALGGRGDAGLVRHGTQQGQVTAVFDVDRLHPSRTVLRDNDVMIDDGEPLMLRRVQNTDGRTRAFINDQTVSAGLLKTVGALLVEIHGQHDERAMIETDTHRNLLDAYGQLGPEVAHVSALYREWRAARNALRQHRAKMEAALKEADYLRASAQELANLAPEAGEEEKLAEKRSALMASEKVATDLNDADEALSGSKSPVPDIAGLLRRLERKAAEVPGLLEETNMHLGKALDHLAEAQSLISRAIHTADFEPRVLEETEERLFALRAAARKFNVPVDELGALAVSMADQLAELDAGESRLGALEKAERACLLAYDNAAAALSAARQAAAQALTHTVMDELPALKLDKARFIVNIESSPETRSEGGVDVVEFWVQTNPGTRAGPMMKVASGGELSRFLLALKVALADKGSAPTLVFDEIDTGVGGAVADAIGNRLARLAKNVQVLSVTHAPQVAARADSHFLISKKAAQIGEDVVTHVHRMDDGDRREEIARMLAGAKVTDAARQAAAQLLEAG